MKLSDVTTAAGSRISASDQYQWQCYGANAQFMEFRDTDGSAYAHCIYDKETSDVYEIHIEVPGQTQAFRWLNPETKVAMYNEATVRGIDVNIAWDDIPYIHVTTEELILEYLKDIGETYYDNLPISESSSFSMPMPGTIGGATFKFGDGFQNEVEPMRYKVNLDVRMRYEVEASSMDEAVSKARKWYESSKTFHGEGDKIYWEDAEIVKEAVERDTNI